MTLCPPRLDDTPQNATDAVMKAVGIDLGGTKIEAQVFDVDWSAVHTKRVATPADYDELVQAVAGLIAWGIDRAGGDVPVGIGAAGLLNPRRGNVLAANHCADGRPLPHDIETAAHRRVTYINDSRAFTLSEAVFGAGRDHTTVCCVILGTGVGGGIAINQTLPDGPTHTGGEFGHCAASAAIVTRRNLAVVDCGCGRTGCVETYISGSGLERLSRDLSGGDRTAKQIAQDRDEVWIIWVEMTADFLRNLILTTDPNVIVLGGGLSKIDGVADTLTVATQAAQIGDFAVPPIVLAQGGDTSGARGAAYAAWLDAP